MMSFDCKMGALQDLNFFLVTIFLIGQLPGNEFIHDYFRKVACSSVVWFACMLHCGFRTTRTCLAKMIAVMIAVMMWRMFGTALFDSAPVGGLDSAIL